MLNSSSLPLVSEPQPLLRPVLVTRAERVLGMDVAEGCGAGCIHCAGGLTLEKYGQDAGMRVDAGSATRLREELGRLAAQGQRPARIRMGLRSDPLWPLPAVLKATRECLQVAFDEGVPVELHTRSVVPEDISLLLRKHPHMVRVVAGLMTVRDTAARVYEANLAHPLARLRSLRALVHQGVQVVVRVEPLVPLVNDTEADLEALIGAVAKHGIKRIELAYLQMTPESARSLSRGLPRMHREMLKGLFASEPWTDGLNGQRKLLPKMLRDAGYERALAVARREGVMATVCPLLEPDFRAPRAARTGQERTEQVKTAHPRQLRAAAAGNRQLGLFGASSDDEPIKH